MTVAELRAILAELPDSAEVLAASSDGMGFSPVLGSYLYERDPREPYAPLYQPDQSPARANFVSLETTLI